MGSNPPSISSPVFHREYELPLRSGIAEKYRTTIVIKDKPDDLLAYVRSLRNTECVILLENRIPTMVYKELIPL